MRETAQRRKARELGARELEACARVMAAGEDVPLLPPGAAKMAIKKHLVIVALATSVSAIGSVSVMAQAPGKLDNPNAVMDPDKPNSGPGVQGAPDTRTGPATRAPGGASTEGTSTGESGATTTPSQDSSGVEGMPGNKSGPAVKPPSGSSAR